MSKIASFAASLTLTGSDEPEGNQIDFGPYLSNVAGISGANTVSPAYMNTVQLLSSASFVPAATTIGPFITPNVFPVYFGLLPVQQTTGVLTLMGGNSDTGVVVSSTNPSFIPVLAGVTNVFTPSQGPNGQASIIVASTLNTPVKVAWI